MAEGLDGELTIVPAAERHARAVAHLWLDAFPGKFGHILGEAARPFLEEWLTRDPSVFAQTTLALVDGEPAGYIQLQRREDVASPAATARRTRQLWPLLAVARRHLGCVGAVRCAARMIYIDSEAIFPGELCVRMIGAGARWRGRGIGSRLLEHAESEARARALPKLSLGVVFENTGAQRLYERHGYVRGSEHRPRLFRWAADVEGYYRMIKTVE